MRKNALRSLQAEFRNEEGPQEIVKSHSNVDDLIESLSRQLKSKPQQFLLSPPKAAVLRPSLALDVHESTEPDILLSSQLDDVLQLDASFALSSPTKSATFSPRKKSNHNNTSRKISFKKNTVNVSSQNLSASRTSVISASASSCGGGFRGSVKRLQGKNKILVAEIDLSKKDGVIAQYEKELAERKKRIAELKVQAEALEQEKKDANSLLMEQKRKRQETLEEGIKNQIEKSKIETKDEATSPMMRMKVQQEIHENSNSENIISKSCQKRACLTALHHVNEKRRNIALRDRSNEADTSARKTALLMLEQSTKNKFSESIVSRLFPFV